MVECGFDPRLTPGTQPITYRTTINLQPQAQPAKMLVKIRVCYNEYTTYIQSIYTSTERNDTLGTLLLTQ